jgi:hypothetical protein
MAQDADEPVERDPELQRQVRLLQRQLNADELAQRDLAEREMLALGPRLLDYLPPVSDSQSAELNTRLTRIRLALETEVAAAVNRPLAIKLQGQHAVSEIVSAIQQQTNNPLQIVGIDLASRVDIEWPATSYWEAVDELADRLKLGFDTESGRQSFLQPVDQAKSRRSLASYHGAFRVSPTRLQFSRDLTSQMAGQWNFSLQLEWEPKLRVIRLELPLDSVMVQHPEDAQRQLAVGQEGQRVSFGVTGERSASLLSFSLPELDGLATDSVDLTGSFRLLVAGREETFRFTDLKTALENKLQIEKSGIKVRLEEVSFDDHLMAIKIGVEFSDAKQSLESHFGWIYQNRIEVIDRDGTAHPYLTIESGGRREHGVSLVYLFDRFEDLSGFTLVYRSPGILLETDVPFHLKGIPIR